VEDLRQKSAKNAYEKRINARNNSHGSKFAIFQTVSLACLIEILSNQPTNQPIFMHGKRRGIVFRIIIGVGSIGIEYTGVKIDWH
jgi:hypothetical protein